MELLSSEEQSMLRQFEAKVHAEQLSFSHREVMPSFPSSASQRYSALLRPSATTTGAGTGTASSATVVTLASKPPAHFTSFNSLMQHSTSPIHSPSPTPHTFEGDENTTIASKFPLYPTTAFQETFDQSDNDYASLKQQKQQEDFDVVENGAIDIRFKKQKNKENIDPIISLKNNNNSNTSTFKNKRNFSNNHSNNNSMTTTNSGTLKFEGKTGVNQSFQQHPPIQKKSQDKKSMSIKQQQPSILKKSEIKDSKNTSNHQGFGATASNTIPNSARTSRSHSFQTNPKPTGSKTPNKIQKSTDSQEQKSKKIILSTRCSAQQKKDQVFQERQLIHVEFNLFQNRNMIQEFRGVLELNKGESYELMQKIIEDEIVSNVQFQQKIGEIIKHSINFRNIMHRF